MTYFTIVHKFIYCPILGEEIPIEGKYRYSDSKEKPYEAFFISAVCPAYENLHKPASKRNPDYRYVHFCDAHPCEGMKGFKKIIDVREAK
ncbi:hypothetical protein [Eubacterium limosum]|uniref:Uncharacterized protein n=1 Tax=Eubacterium limosum TaxID=1736 RepID=A0ABT5UUS7_EUBLI|nr:hypothetical protein [Eubacterium limosum]MDE1472724.1 hypothetical protein [Eubacterium limosum]